MKKFTAEEIKEIVRFAQLLAPGFSEEQYQSLVQMQEEMAGSGFIETAYGLHRLEQKYGIPCSQALDKYVQLVEEKAKLEPEVADLRKKREFEEARLAEALAAGQKARAERGREEQELASFRQKAEQEKRAIKQQLERAKVDAEVQERDIASAGTLKAQLKRYGINVELAAKLLSEFAGGEAALVQMAEAAAEYGSQLEARASLRRENEAEEQKTQSTREERARLTADCQRLQDTRHRLTSDLGQQEALRRFQARYQTWSGVQEHLARWNQVIPMRCGWLTCGAHFLVDRAPSHFRTRHVCPCCGLSVLYYDEGFYSATGQPYASPIQVRLE
ncbi:MAG: hypothetical protein Q8O76_11295 [Chloroflexota bacterium]|nr:hypothetical protein [Chloroflexota bacterium]